MARRRGTLHIVAAEDLAWMLRVTGERQLRVAAPRHRELGLDAEVLGTVERVVVGALRGGGRLTRGEIFDLLERAGIDPAGQRGLHALQSLALRGIVCQGPVVSREGAVSREQWFVLVDEHIAPAPVPADPAAEVFVRYVIGHGPARPADFAWWSGLTLGAARAAAAASADDERIREVDDGLFVARTRPRRAAAGSEVLALGAFEEYYISYADRSAVASDEVRAAVGPGRNGMVRPILLQGGEVVGTWRQSTAVGRHADEPIAELFDAVDDESVAAALSRYAAFITG